MTVRHDEVVARLKRASERKFRVLAENRTVDGSALRPDLVLVKGNEALIIDVTVPNENRPRPSRLRVGRGGDAKGRFQKVSVEPVVVGQFG
jgi:hypothetical protein